MEVVATPEETKALLDRSAPFMAQRRDDWACCSLKPRSGAVAVSPLSEDRRFPIRMTDELRCVG